MSKVRVEFNGDSQGSYDVVRDVSGTVLPTRTRIEVSREDWQRGQPKDPEACGIVRAARRVFAEQTCWVGADGLEVVTPGGEYLYLLPRSAHVATWLFDRLGAFRVLLPALSFEVVLEDQEQ